MANLTEIPQWEDGVYQIETSDPVLGGPEGVTNKPLKQLANRTAWLKEQIDGIGDGLEEHLTSSNPHPEMFAGGQPGQVWTPDGWKNASSGVPLGTILAIGVNFSTPVGFVEVSYSNCTYHPIGTESSPGLPKAFVDGYYCGDANNATAAFGFRCNVDGSVRGTTGEYLAFEPAANRFYRGRDDTGGRDPFGLHTDAIRNITGSFGTYAFDVEAKDAFKLTTAGGSGGGNGGGSKTIWTFDASRVVPTGDRVVPEHIDKKFIMKVFDGAVGDPALVDWQEWLNKWAEMQASKVPWAEFTGQNQLLQAPGYQKLPGGLILQWGGLSGAYPATGEITLPITYENRVFAAAGSFSGTSPQQNNITLQITGAPASTIKYAATAGGAWSWFAIGS